MTPDKIITILQQTPANYNAEQEQLQLLGTLLNDLIQNDFEGLIQILYRVDVSEKKVKELLQQEPDSDAGHLLARLLLQRQKEKLETRNNLRKPSSNISEEEQW